MKITLPQDDRAPQIQLTIQRPDVISTATYDDTFTDVNVADDAIRVDARYCDGRGRIDERRAPICLFEKPGPPAPPQPKVDIPMSVVEPPKYVKTPEPKMPTPEPKAEPASDEKPSKETKSEE